MIRTLTKAAAMSLIAWPALALDLDAMSDAERQAFRAEVRAYLMENPEVIMEAVEVLRQRDAAAEAANDMDLVQAYASEIFDDGYSWVGGNPDGDITLVEFLDYRCGYCKKAHGEVKELVESDGNIRLIYKELPILGEDSVLASRFAVAVKQVEGNDAYADTHDALMAMKGEVTPTALSRLAEALGYDSEAIMDQMDTDDVAEEIAKTRALAARLSISGTPTFVMKDELLRGYAPLDVMRALVAGKRDG
ncbi:Protein-disulfide isomerase [Shimia gijangensis]|uniref:Protein-disulfide isomerase n=1 Tax=Shimia gijangensis TaxID=1470563 RepID=A0A1M6N839_9RHOB|nr:DsbA family protein [Shimia gijangensis]SHJ91910.1 Protein-disulfide isomerase [Shimia gijangensis]